MRVQNLAENYFSNHIDLANAVEKVQCEDREVAPNRRAVVKHFNFPAQDLSSKPYKRTILNQSIREVNKNLKKIIPFDQEIDVKSSVRVPVEVTVAGARIPSFEKMDIQLLKSPFNRLNALLLSVPSAESPTEFVKAAFMMLYSLFQSKAPAITFRANRKNLHFKGSYSEEFSTCAFEAQAWRVDKFLHAREWIIELRQTSKSGRRAFEDLKLLVALALKDEGFVRTYANGLEIHSSHTYDSDLGELSMPGTLRNENNTCPVTLQKEDVANMAAILAERRYPQCVEIVELLARWSAGSEDNRDVIRTNLALAKAIHEELRTGFDASFCYNALKLIQQGSISLNDVLPTVARSLQVHSGYKQSGHRRPRSRAIECTALGVMEMLTCEKGVCYQVEALRKIERELRGTVRSDVFRRIQDIRVRQDLSLRVY